MGKGSSSSIFTGLGILFYFLTPSIGVAAERAGEPNGADVCHFGHNGVITDANEYRIYLLHQQSDLYRLYDKKCDGNPELTLSDWVAYKNAQDDKNALKVHDFNRQIAMGKPFKIPPTPSGGPEQPAPTATGTGNQAETKKCPPTGWHSTFVLRDSYTDVSSFSCPSDAKSASGAQFGWSRDAIAANTSWSAKGIVAESITWWGTPNSHEDGAFEPYLAAFSVTPSIRFERLDNSNIKLKSKNTDVLAYSATAETAVGHIFDDTIHFFRARGTLVSDFEGNEKSWMAVGEWQPVTNQYVINLGSPNPLGPLPVTWEVDSTFRAEYSAAQSGTLDPIFAHSNSVFRYGGVVAVTLAAEHLESVPAPLQRISANGSYLWLTNTATNKPYPLFNGALTYNLDESGHFGIKMSFQKGKIEETGKGTNTQSISLSSKF